MDIEMKIFKDPCPIKHDVYLMVFNSYRIFTVKFIGEYRYGHRGNDDAPFIESIVKSLFAYSPDGFILDFTELKYEW